ncbi:MAG: hypothetical protein Q9165_007272 [Trypethelium subeluteriae]
MRLPDISGLDGWIDTDMVEYSDSLGGVSTPDGRPTNTDSAPESIMNDTAENFLWHLASKTMKPRFNLLSETTGRQNSDSSIVPGWPKSSASERGRSTCNCLRVLADQLCHLNTLENKHDSLYFETILSETDTTRNCAQTVLECHRCRLDLKVALLMTTVLQIVLDWLSTELRHKAYMQQVPKVSFGTWKVPESDAVCIKKLLTYRILTTSEAVVNSLRVRVDEIAVKASKQSENSRFRDAETLQQTLLRLAGSLRELLMYIKH